MNRDHSALSRVGPSGPRHPSNPCDSFAELLLETGRDEESIEPYREPLDGDAGFAASYYGIAANPVYRGRRDEARWLCLAAANFDPLLDLNHAYVRRAALDAAGCLP